MHDDVWLKIGQQTVDHGKIRDRVLNQGQPVMPLKIVAATGRKVVDCNDFITLSQHHVDHGRPDLPRTAGYKHFHRHLSLS